jgi:hypothetical protein
LRPRDNSRLAPKRQFKACAQETIQGLHPKDNSRLTPKRQFKAYTQKTIQGLRPRNNSRLAPKRQFKAYTQKTIQGLHPKDNKLEEKIGSSHCSCIIFQINNIFVKRRITIITKINLNHCSTTNHNCFHISAERIGNSC